MTTSDDSSDTHAASSDDVEKVLIGSRERCRLPDIGLGVLVARVDTGATTSALHVDAIARFRRGRKSWLRVTLRRGHHQRGAPVQVELPLHDRRDVTSSNGAREARYVISTTLRMGDREWPIEVTLTDRARMRSSLLLGREALNGRVVIDPEQQFLLGRPPKRKRKAPGSGR